MALPAKAISEIAADQATKSEFSVKDFGFALAGYFMFDGRSQQRQWRADRRDREPFAGE
jgi:hypothetical protein